MEEENSLIHAIELQTHGFVLLDKQGDDNLMLALYRNQLLETLATIDTNNGTAFFYGDAPDNDSAGEDELLYNGTVVRLIAKEIALPLTEDSQPEEIIDHFKTLVAHAEYCFYTVFEEQGQTKTQTTVEFIF